MTSRRQFLESLSALLGAAAITPSELFAATGGASTTGDRVEGELEGAWGDLLIGGRKYIVLSAQLDIQTVEGLSRHSGPFSVVRSSTLAFRVLGVFDADVLLSGGDCVPFCFTTEHNRLSGRGSVDSLVQTYQPLGAEFIIRVDGKPTLDRSA